MGKITHGFADTPIYRSWQSMKRRCYKITARRYKDYGGRGIRVCKHWMKFENFLRDMGPKPTGMTLERIDNNKGYYPSNCKWASYKEQARNRRRKTRLITFKGRTQCLLDWAAEVGIKPTTLYARLFLHKWPISEAMTRNPYCFRNP